jgi:hypothetical protein
MQSWRTTYQLVKINDYENPVKNPNASNVKPELLMTCVNEMKVLTLRVNP